MRASRVRCIRALLPYFEEILGGGPGMSRSVIGRLRASASCPRWGQLAHASRTDKIRGFLELWALVAFETFFAWPQET